VWENASPNDNKMSLNYVTTAVYCHHHFRGNITQGTSWGQLKERSDQEGWTTGVRFPAGVEI
jgi:hypothetical protein